MRLGQSSERIRDLQRVMHAENYRAIGGGPLDQDGVYRPSMQGALLDFQRDHGVPQTGNIDPATLRMAPSLPGRAMDQQDHFQPHRPMPPPESPPPRAPGHPDHSDHRPGLSHPLPPAVNQDSGGRAALDPREPGSSQALAQLSPQDRQLFDKIRSGTPAHLSDEVVAQALYSSKQAGIDSADKVANVAAVGDRLFVGGTVPGFHAAVDIAQPAPSLQDTVQKTLAFNQQQSPAQPQEPSQAKPVHSI